MKILLARQYQKNDEFSNCLESELENRNIKAEIVKKYTKDDVLELLRRDKSFTVLVLEEYLQEYLPTDIDFFDDLLKLESKLNIVFIVSNEHKSKKRLIKSLYNAGIYNVLYEEDTDAGNIVNLIIGGRDKKVAKTYMGLDYDEETDFLSQPISSNDNHIKNIEDCNYTTVFEENNHKKKERVIAKERIIKKEIVRHVYSIPKDYKKVIAIWGFENSGATTLAVNLSYALSKKKVKTTLIDTDHKKKDIYYHFSKDYFGCLSKIMGSQNCFVLGQPINKFLTVFSEHHDIDFSLSKDSLFKLLGQAKRGSDIVVVDVSSNLKEDIVKGLLEFADNIVIVADQNINKLYRISKQMPLLNESILSAQLVINRYIEKISHLDKDSICKNFFKDLKGEKDDVERGINQVFVVRNDLCSIIQGLADRKPAISLKDCMFLEDINEIANFYYMKETNRKGLFKKAIELIKR